MTPTESHAVPSGEDGAGEPAAGVVADAEWATRRVVSEAKEGDMSSAGTYSGRAEGMHIAFIE